MMYTRFRANRRELDAVSITARGDKKKKREKKLLGEIGGGDRGGGGGGGWRNLPFMRGGYGSRGVCRLIRVFLVRFLFSRVVPFRHAAAAANGPSQY